MSICRMWSVWLFENISQLYHHLSICLKATHLHMTEEYKRHMTTASTTTTSMKKKKKCEKDFQTKSLHANWFEFIKWLKIAQTHAPVEIENVIIFIVIEPGIWLDAYAYFNCQIGNGKSYFFSRCVNFLFLCFSSHSPDKLITCLCIKSHLQFYQRVCLCTTHTWILIQFITLLGRFCSILFHRCNRNLFSSWFSC